MSHPDLERVLAACDARQQRDLGDLFRLLRQPSISTQNVGVAECAALVEELLAAAGLAARRYPTAGHPMVYAERCYAPGMPTVLIWSEGLSLDFGQFSASSSRVALTLLKVNATSA